VDSAERYFKNSMWAQFDDNEREQLEVLMEAFVLFQAREQKYHSLWQQYGAVDSYHHMMSKSARCQFYLEGVTDDESDPLDLINYSAFLIRNVRAGRIKNSVYESNGPVEVVEEWLVVDRWWTGDAIRKEFRMIKIEGSENITQYRENDDPVWHVVPSNPTKPEQRG